MTIGIYGGDGREDFEVWNRHEKTINQIKQNETKQTKQNMFFCVQNSALTYQRPQKLLDCKQALLKSDVPPPTPFEMSMGMSGDYAVAVSK